MKRILKKIKTIVLSRTKKDKTVEDWVTKRREICRTCTYNSKNQRRISVKARVLIYLSDFYSYITGNSEKDNLGNCTACESCSIFYKTDDLDEKCPKKLWK